MSVFITIPVLSIKYTAVPTELIKYSPPHDDTDSLGVKHIIVGTPLYEYDSDVDLLERDIE